MIKLKRKYAKFLIEGCLKLKKGDKLFISGNNLINDFIELVKEEAKKLEIYDIEVLITNLAIQKELYETNDYEKIISSSYFDKTKYNIMAKGNYAILNLFSPVPDFFDGIDEELMSKVAKRESESIKTYREYQAANKLKWLICAVPNNLWASSINISTEKLWELILKVCLIYEEKPIEAWQKKMTILKDRAKYLNDLKIDKLIYTNSLGTSLEIGLPKDYLFLSADGSNIVNMPTEEVFTSPHKLKVNGVVYSSKPLYYNNNLIEDFSLEFKDGRIINYQAKKGYETLKGIIEADEGSHYLGEVALVDYSSSISETKIVYKNTLLDENASCHLAIGESFNDCVINGLEKSKDELIAMGLNVSKIHVDFFIGTKDLNVLAILQNGKKTFIMKEGNFVKENINDII